MYTIGIDIGSLTTKIVILKEGQLFDAVSERSSYNFKKIGTQLFVQLLQKHNINKQDIGKIIGTGYGRYSIDIPNEVVTEITAHARGVQYYYPDARSIIDIGGQDSKVIVISKKTGKVLDFQMNDKCAAGTGRFLEVMSNALNVDIAEFGSLALQSINPESISSMCTVFAESEVISLFAKGSLKEDIAMGIHSAIAKRVSAMAKRINIEPQTIFCGGVAKNPAVKSCLEKELKFELTIPPDPQITGALGAALIGYEKMKA